ncbi:toprim domain-containing protein [Inquilinus sp. OTU3971]|uniref:toprim domain-containing protein n=1 Tax=Inquilinus sp. OTU3971 TaxID=3043855 RepID=UPI00313E4FB7
MSAEFDEALDALDMEFLCDHEGIDYKITHGSSGQQLHLKECPFCGNSKWKTYANLETGRGNCFVCSTGFNKWSFIRAHLGDPTVAGVRDFVRQVVRAQGWRPKRRIAVAVDETTIKLPLSFPLPTEDGQNLVYLERRGITAELAGYFRLRFCADDWWRYIRDDGKPGGQNFGNRVIIPVYNLDGELVTFQGRDILGTSDRKYLFPMKLPATGRFLYNGQNARRAKRAVMGEGAFDVIALKAAVDEDEALRDIVPIGSFGKHLSYGSADGVDQLGQLLALKRGGLEEVIICWDGEVEALEAAIEAALRIGNVGLLARVALLPKDKDPNEVAPAISREAIYKAILIDRHSATRLRLKNPYR